MSYEERITAFWQVAERLRLDSYQIAFYFCLLRFFNEAGNPTHCAVSNGAICKALDIDIRTLRAIRARLIANNLIAYEAGTGRKQPTYSLDVVPNSEPKPKPKAKASEQRRRKPKEVRQVRELTLFREPKPRGKPPREFPAREDVISTCIAKGMDEEEAQVFFDYYDAQGWVTSSGQRITRIDSMINRWLNNNKKNGNRTNSKATSSRDAEIVRYILDGL